MNRQETPEQKLEAALHQRVKALVSKRTQGYIMGAFRDALAAAKSAGVVVQERQP